MKNYLHIAKQVIETETKALVNLATILDESFNRTTLEILKVKGKIVVTGIGKSGHIGRKIASSFASTGTPSFFLHPSEAIHGDLGMISKDDLVLAIANSGETTEIVRLIPFTKENNIPLISISSKPNSTLAQSSTVHINIGEFEEACPLNLAPTTSSSLTLIVGDALMVALMKGRNFDEQNYAKFHPGGSLGSRLLDTVADVMKTEQFPLVEKNATMQEVIYTINSGRCGLTIVGNTNNIAGIITDGDLRRAMDISKKDFFDLDAQKVMTKSPKFIDPSIKLIDAKNIMNSYKITSLLVGTKTGLKGVLQLHNINF